MYFQIVKRHPKNSQKVFKSYLKEKKGKPPLEERKMVSEKQWQKATSWVHSHRQLVNHIAAPYRQFMASDKGDIEQEAILTAFCTLTIFAEKGAGNSTFGAYFRVQFRTRCIKLAAGGIVSSESDIDQLPSTETHKKIADQDRVRFEQALAQMTNRQRQVAHWILSQPTPVSTSLVAEKFGIHRRTVRAIICNAVKRIERRKKRGHKKLRKDIPFAA